MSGLLHQNSSGENSLSPSEKILMRRILVTWLEKVQQDLNKFEHLRYSGYKDHCTIHGLYDVFISKSYLERFIWILTLVGCFILAIMCSKIAVNEWYQSIETTNTYFESWDLNMPDIIICPDLLLKKSEIDTLLDGAVAEDDEYKTKFLNPKRPGNLQDKFKFYTRKVKEMKRFIDYSTMIEHAEFPNMYLPFLPRNYPDRVLSLVEQGNAYEDAKMVFGNNTDFYLLKEFFRMQHIWGANYNERLNLSKIAYQCDSIFLTYDASLRVLKLFQNKTFNKLSFSRTLRNLIPNLDEILNVTERNFTDQEILSLHGIINFCNSEYVKETFDYHHKCYRFDSKEIFLSNDKNSIGIILPNDTVHGLLGEKGLWFSIVHDSRDITGKLIPKEEIDEIGPIQTSAINNLSWVYIRPGMDF
uniref:Uncharacterized protein n=1 Tax=Acrobeloides nanus TaxID=290746 RepID=A0A914DWU4_9BILA